MTNAFPVLLAVSSLLWATPTKATQINEDARLLVELHTAAVCFIKDGYDAPSTIRNFYNYLDSAEIPHPKPGTLSAEEYWQVGLMRATPQKCKQLLNIKPDFTNI